METIKKAMTPDEVTPLFLEFFAANDVEGIVSLFEDDAVMVPGVGVSEIRGKEYIRQVYLALLEHKPTFANVEHRPTITSGDIALTSTRFGDGHVTAEVVRKQPDGSWRWVIDQPAFSIEK